MMQTDVITCLEKLRINQVAETFQELKERWGTPKALYSMFMQWFSRVTGIRVAFLLVRPIYELSSAPALPEGYSLRVLSAEQALEYTEVAELELPARFLSAAERRGDHCVCAFYAGELVSYVWRAYSTTPLQDGIDLQLGEGYRYGYKALTLASHRGLRLQQSITLHSDITDYPRGFRYALSYIATHNYASIISDKRRGNEIIGFIVWISNRLFTLCYTSPGGKRRGIKLVRR